jgi:DNA primase
MTPEKIFELYDLLGSKNVVQRGEWIMGSCPFSKYEHSNGSDNRPSFGISISNPSFYHCFACGAKNPVSMLPTVLTFITGENYNKLREFITEHEVLEFKPFDEIVTISNKRIGVIPESILKAYTKVPIDILSKLYIDLKASEDYNLLYDNIKQCVVYPIYDGYGRLVGIRNRYVGDKEVPSKYYSRTDLHPDGDDAKNFGIWYGMDKFIPDKPLMLVEGERDVLLVKQTGLVANVWGSVSASLSKRQIRTIQDTTVTKIILFFDNDMAGKKATQKMWDSLKNLTRVYRITDYQGCKDPAELVETGLLKKALNSIKECVK